MRYTLHDSFCAKIGEAETAQGIADLAVHGTYSVDSASGMKYPFTTFEYVDGIGITGTMHETIGEVMLDITLMDKN